MSDKLTKDVLRESFGGQTATPSFPPQPPHCVDVVKEVPNYSTWTLTDPVTGVVASGLYQNGTTTTIEHVCSPGSPGVPGTPGIAPSFTTTFNMGWTGSAVSVDSLTGDGQYQFSVSTGAVGVVTGFNDVDTGSSYLEIEHGIYCTNGLYAVVESGVQKTANAAFATSDVFTIRRLGGEVAYFKGSTLIYTSTVRSTGTVFADCSLYLGGDEILDPSISATVDSSFAGISGGATGTLMGPRGFASDGTQGVGSPPPGGPTDPGGGPGTNGGTDSNGDWAGRSGGTLRSLVGVAISYDSGSVGTGTGTGSGGSGSQPDGDYVGRSGNQLRGLVGQAFGSSDAPGTPNPGTYYGVCAGVLNDPSSAADGSGGVSGGGGGGLFQPQFAVAAGVMTPVAGFSIALAGMVGTVAGKLGQLHGNSGNVTTAGVGSGANGGSGNTPSTGEGGGSGGDNALPNGDYAGRIGGELRGLVGLSFDSAAAGQAFLHGLLPTPSLFAHGQVVRLTDANGNPVPGYGTRASLPVPTLAAQGGVAVSLTLPVPTLNASGTTTLLGEVSAKVPVPTLNASGTTTIVARLQAELPGKPKLVARGGARVAASLPVPTLKASGTTGRLARAAATLPVPTLVASGTTGVVGNVSGVLPGLRTAGVGVVVLSTPRIVLRASGTADVAIEYEAYSVTLLPGSDGNLATATTHYTNFPFDRIVRFGGKYYGVAADGLYELDGDDYNGTPIVSVVQTAESDFGKKQPKRPTHVWMGGTLPDDLKVSCLTDGEDVSGVKYRDRIVRDSAARRVFFGRGARGHWLAFRITNSNGKEFEIEQFDPEFDVLRREV